ncbi:MAG TPA: hypothetical protein VF458_18915 [Ktedonobacteraceae bacterium]
MAQTTPPTGDTGWWERLVACLQRFVSSGCIRAALKLIDFIFNGHFILATGKWQCREGTGCYGKREALLRPRQSNFGGS